MMPAMSLEVMRSVGTTSLFALAHPAVGLAMSGKLGVVIMCRSLGFSFTK